MDFFQAGWMQIRLPRIDLPSNAGIEPSRSVEEEKSRREPRMGTWKFMAMNFIPVKII